MIQRLQVQLTILFAAFVLLVIVSVGVTYWGLQTQQQDALVINLSGRQRMLVQQMTRLALQLQVQNVDESWLLLCRSRSKPSARHYPLCNMVDLRHT